MVSYLQRITNNQKNNNEYNHSQVLHFVLFPAVIILHKDSVLGIGEHWGIVLGSVPLDVLISVGIVVLIWIVVLVRIVLIVRI